MNTICHNETTDKDLRRRRFAAWTGNIVFCLTVAALCGWALYLGIRTTWECQWPAEWDTLRDIGMAQSILDGRYPEDPILLGETLWYNPLTGGIIALSGKVSGLSLHRVSIIIGPFFNLLAPLGMVVLLAMLLGRAAAVAGLCVVLFAKDPHTSFWVHACYSPWLLAPLYSLGLFFLTLTACYRGVTTRNLRWFLLAGLMLGVTFMAHTAPALVAGGAMALALAVELGISCYGLYRQRRGSQKESSQHPYRELCRLPFYFFVLLAIAFVVSLPFTWSILWNYRFQVHNPFPSLYAADYVSLSHLPVRLREAVNWRNAVALAGAIALAWRCRGDAAARFIGCWAVVVAAFVCQHYLWQALLARGIVLTAFVPGHHAAIHLSAVRAVLFAAGATALGATAAGYGHVLLKRGVSACSLPILRQLGAATGAILAGLALYLANPLATRVDFLAPDAALYHEYHEQGIPMYQWILDNTTPDAVFLCEEETIGMTVVMPAGRKLVSAMLLYSNPYVPPAPLFEAQRTLFDTIERGERDAFCAIASRYPVLFLLVSEESAQTKQAQFAAFFDEAGRAGNLVVWRARPCFG